MRGVWKVLTGLALGTAAARLAAQAIDTGSALGGLREARAACEADHGTLWGRNLCGPIALVSRRSHLVVANDTVPGWPYVPMNDGYVTALPSDQGVANTSFTWQDREWTMVVLPLPDDRFSRIALLLHEVFHREQNALGLRARDALNNQLDTRAGRTWLRLEYRALARALVATDSAPTDVRRHVANALLFRAYRRSLFPGSDSLETSLEMQEGLPEYNGERLALQMTGLTPARVARVVTEREHLGTYVRGFAYGTGPALGVLLDRFAPAWRTQVRTHRDPAGLLAEAIQFRPPPRLGSAARDRAREYGWAQVDSEEGARELARAPAMRSYQARLVEGPTISFRQSRDSLAWGFDPNTLIGYDLSHTIYPTGSFNGPWGSLSIDSGGVLVRNDMAVLTIEAPVGELPPGRHVTGRGWSLDLNVGWRLVPDSTRRGSYVVVTTP
ncbi:MAG TPA: hypothetical protein VFP39_17100 [Gemmatimonadales bacterium]|nr:hypothetical protein [Gemmatimonadales bacterium]